MKGGHYNVALVMSSCTARTAAVAVVYLNVIVDIVTVVVAHVVAVVACG